jgi:thymidylate synthase
MKQWHALMREVAMFGEKRRRERTGVGTLARFGMRAEWDLRDGFPAVTTKRLAFAQVAAELACFLRGDQWLSEFNDGGCKLWDGNAMAPAWLAKHRTHDEDVWLGRIYGVQWRGWRSWREIRPGLSAQKETDQITALMEGLDKDPHGRRHIVTAWNPGELEDMCLPPCPILWQCFASDEGGERWIDLQFYQRSVDLFLGFPFDAAQFALLLHLLGRALGRRPRRLVAALGDVHLYLNHFAQVTEALQRPPLKLPSLLLSEECSGPIGFEAGAASLVGYDSHPAIAARLNV